MTLPLSMPGIVSGSLDRLRLDAVARFATPELLGGGRVKMIANVVKDLALDSFNWPGGGGLRAWWRSALTLALLMGGLGRLAAGRDGGLMVRLAVLALSRS